MSMEDAILEHAGALKELAAAIRDAVKFKAHADIAAAAAGAAGALSDTLLQDKAAELAATRNKRVAATAEALKKDQAANAQGIDATLAEELGARPAESAETQAARNADATVAAVNKEIERADKAVDVVAAVSAEIEAKGTVAPDAGDATVVLDYAKDVRPKLLEAIKKGKRAEIEAHLAGAGVAKADQLKPEQLPAILKLATELAA